THHLAFVILVGPEHIEEFQPHPLRRELCAFLEAGDHGAIEQMLAEAVKIHRLQTMQNGPPPAVLETLLPLAARPGRGSIEETRARRRAPVTQFAREERIVGKAQ